MIDTIWSHVFWSRSGYRIFNYTHASKCNHSDSFVFCGIWATCKVTLWPKFMPWYSVLMSDFCCYNPPIIPPMHNLARISCNVIFKKVGIPMMGLIWWCRMGSMSYRLRFFRLHFCNRWGGFSHINTILLKWVVKK